MGLILFQAISLISSVSVYALICDQSYPRWVRRISAVPDRVRRDICDRNNIGRVIELWYEIESATRVDGIE